MKLVGKRILVTGGGLRIGRGISQHLSQAGAEIVIHYRHSRDVAEETAEDIRSSGGTAETVQGDLAEESGSLSVLEQCFKEGPLDGLVNCAAAFNRTPLAESSRQTFLDEFGPNLFGPPELLRGFAAQEREGVVVNLLDRRIAAHDAGAVPYHLSKIALAEATRLAALEYGPRLRVNGVAPGPILPPPGQEHVKDYIKLHGGKTVLDHACGPEDIAHAVHYLFTAPAVTGQVIFIDAGQHLLGNGV